jgi:hypothetical protein
MTRDKYKNDIYFNDRINFYEKSLRRFLELETEIPRERLRYVYAPLSDYYLKLVYNEYSKGGEKEKIFEYYKSSLYFYSLLYETKDSIYTLIDYLSLAVLFEDSKEEFIQDIEKIFSKYQALVDAGEQYEDGYIDTLALYLLEGQVENFRSHLEYLNMIGNDADSVIEAQQFWYYAHSDAWWYDTHKADDAYDGYWSFDTAALCKMRGIYDERFKDLDFFPYDLLVQEDK